MGSTIKSIRGAFPVIDSRRITLANECATKFEILAAQLNKHDEKECKNILQSWIIDKKK